MANVFQDPESGETTDREYGRDVETDLDVLCGRPGVDAVIVVPPTTSTRAR